MTEARFRVKMTAAARLAGVHRTTIHRAILSGRLSATKAHDGTRRVDVAELERAFGTLHAVAPPVALQHPATSQPVAPVADVALLEVKLEAVERERDRLLADLDRERTEKARLLGVVEAQQRLITHQQPAPVRPEAPMQPPRRRPPRPPRKVTPKSEPTLTDVANTLVNWLRR
jgi:hypothetical protein